MIFKGTFKNSFTNDIFSRQIGCSWCVECYKYKKCVDAANMYMYRKTQKKKKKNRTSIVSDLLKVSKLNDF